MTNRYNSYNTELKIDVLNQILYSNVEVNYICSLPSTTVLNFYIHKDMEIEEIQCDRTMLYMVEKETEEWSPFVLESKRVKLTFIQEIYEHQTIKINFKYKGHINIVTDYGLNRLTKDWIELGIYTPWFPLSEQIEQALFHVTIQIDNDYKVINAKKIGEHSVITQLEPNSDCPIIASNCFQCKESFYENMSVHVYFTEERFKDLALKLSDYTVSILDYYQRFGAIDSQELSIVIAPREDGGGYCRTGLIVLTADAEVSEIEYFKFVAHELAHLWWCKVKNSNTWEDWLNESFAEFSALLVLRNTFGLDEYNKIITAFKKMTKSIPPIIGLDRQDENARLVLYMKGPIMLSKLEKHIGELKFEQLLSAIHTSNIDTTDRLIEKLYEITNQETRDYLIDLLHQ